MNNKLPSKVYLLIPAYNPDEQLLTLITHLPTAEYPTLIINDGSDEKMQPLFEACAKLPNVTVLNHDHNQGKGAALKTGFHYLLEHAPDCLGVVTLDADGQHLVQDVIRLAQALEKNPNHFILGVREFSGKTPARSKFGNELTRWLFKKIYKREVSDTQTGLRAIPKALLSAFVEFHSNRYDFELECLMYLADQAINVQQITISTVYIDDNRSSHFNPILDSFRVYFVFLRFIIISFLSFLIDLSIFSLCHYSGANLISSVVIARIISSLFNFYNNKYLVYKAHRSKLGRELKRYGILAVGIMLSSYLLIKLLNQGLGISVIPAKIMADAFLFIISFMAQGRMIFRRDT